jgi:hypothetical protein
MVIGGLTTLLWDGHLEPWLKRYKTRRRHESSPDGFTESTAEAHAVPLREVLPQPDLIYRRTNASLSKQSAQAPPAAEAESPTHAPREALPTKAHTIRISVGLPIIIFFFGKHSFYLSARD